MAFYTAQLFYKNQDHGILWTLTASSRMDAYKQFEHLAYLRRMELVWFDRNDGYECVTV